MPYCLSERYKLGGITIVFVFSNQIPNRDVVKFSSFYVVIYLFHGSYIYIFIYSRIF